MVKADGVSDHTVYVYGPAGHVVGEYIYAPSSNTMQEHVWLGDTPIANVRSSTGTPYYVLADLLNTPRRMVNPSNSSAVWTWKGEAFGVDAPTQATSSAIYNLRFPGRIYDAESGKHYNYFRDYDPAIGRYLESDPIGLAGGLNTCGYVGGGPVFAVDPFGLESTYELAIKRAIARGDIEELKGLLDAAATSQQRALAQNALNRFAQTGQQIISKECKSSVREVFPGQWRDRTLKEILDAARSGDETAKTAWKLLNDLRFKK